MGIKYILVGGYPHKASDRGKSFCEELIAGFDESVRILDCLFARPTDNWDKAFEQDKDFFVQHVPDKRLELQRAEPERFVEQVKWANAIYIRGGTTSVLLELLKQSGEWQKELEGKTVAGSSAGAHALSTYHYNLDGVECGEGLGLVPVKVFVHWRSDYHSPHINWDKAYTELKSYREDLPLLILAEGQFVKYEKRFVP